MLGWASRARVFPSRRKRACITGSSSAMLMNFTATRASKRPSVRRASQTLPIPPCPRSDSRV